MTLLSETGQQRECGPKLSPHHYHHHHHHHQESPADLRITFRRQKTPKNGKNGKNGIN
jgi:hypothetical protein